MAQLLTSLLVLGVLLASGADATSPTLSPEEESMVSPCAYTLCSEGTTCTVVDGQASCVEQFNPCSVTLCVTGTTCTVVNGQARCIAFDPCSISLCSNGSTCRVVKGVATCKCPSVADCRREKRSAPVCGSDGRTYSNQCTMEVAACERGEGITKKHDGKCRQCKDSYR